MISSLTMSEVSPACLSCSNKIIFCHNSLGSDDKNLVESPEAMVAGDLSNFRVALSLVRGRPIFF